MDIYEKLVENPLFFKWIYFPSAELEEYWNSYLKQNPSDAPKILDFKKQFEKHLKYKQNNLSEHDKKRIAEEIIRNMNSIDQKRKRTVLVYSFLKYAAVAFLFFLAGSGLVYLFMESRQTEIVFESTVNADPEGPMLITEDQRIELNKGKSELDYSGDAEIILDQNKKLAKDSGGSKAEMNTLVIPYGNRSELTLSDGSKVWLNAGSRLIYPSSFVDKTREVFLVGEAFFKISKNESKPFMVKTADLKVKVVGTSFNVSAYPEDYSVQTVLSEGSVEVSRNNAGLFGNKITLVPGQMAYYNKKSKETSLYEVDVNVYTSWTDGVFTFSNTDLNRIVKKLERFYNISFRFDDPMKGDIQITGKLDVTTNKKEVLEYLSKLTGLEFIKLNEEQYIIK